MVTSKQFLKEVKKIFPNATLESIRISKKFDDFTWGYGGVSKNNYPDKYSAQIDKINKMWLKVRKKLY